MPDSIDATVVLGLAGKVSRVFAEPDTYLSFPLASIGMERAKFHALAADPLSLAGQQGLTEFSLLVNELPSGPLWQPTGSHRLWDVYGDVLGAHLAEANRTPAEEAAYHHAYALLYQTQPDGSATDSPAVIAYQQYRDAYRDATFEYNNRHGQADAATDPAVRAQWAKDEPILQSHVADAEQDWANKGHRHEVEESRRVLRDVGSKSPSTVWAGYRKLFDPDLPEIFFRSSIPDGWMYVPTAYMPSDAVDMAWASITVTRNELSALAGAAPADLRSRLGGSTDTAIELVSFEYSSVTLNRGWFAPEAFASGAWKFYEPGRVLSDGGKPPKGECTAYVSGLVLARNITVRHQATGRPPLNLGFVPTTRVLTRMSIASPQLANSVRERVDARRVLQLKVATRQPPPIIGAQPVIAPVMRATPTALRRPIYAAAVQPRGPLAMAPAVRTAMPLLAKQPPLTAIVLPTPTGGPSTTTDTTDPNHVYILAFICRPLPKAPNPNPALKW